jgi:hypothetical protein
MANPKCQPPLSFDQLGMSSITTPKLSATEIYNVNLKYFSGRQGLLYLAVLPTTLLVYILVANIIGVLQSAQGCI